MSLAASETLKTSPDTVALADERQSFTWTALDPVLNRATNALLARDGTARIAVFAQNSAETVIAYLAALQAGVASVPVNFHLTVEELVHILRDSGAGIVFAGPETVEVALAAAAAVGGLKVVAWRTAAKDGVTAWADWLAEASAAEPPTDMPPKAHLHYTSGTTGTPKGVETPPTMFLGGADVAEFVQRLRAARALLGDRSPVLAVGPLYHTGPLSAVRQLAAGASVVVVSRFDPEAVLRAIETHRVKSTVMVPTHFQRLLSLPEDVRRRYDVSSLVAVSHTGAACPRDVKEKMITWFGPVLIEAYGATESGTTNSITSAEWLERPGSVGKTLAPFELLVIGENGEARGPGEIGQLYFRDTNGRGIVYHNDAEKTRAAHLRPGVFTLGEIGYADAEGYVFITDRVSDMIVSGGVNIYPAEVEAVLLDHPAVADVAVIGAPNTEMGEEVKALVVLRPAAVANAGELEAFCRQKLAGYKCPRSFEFVADIGRNAMGKINKRQLRRPYWPSERTIGG
ncbi:Long-chain-fatty-acid--CoA ligase [Alphaproteobacteria bacterium SO-S41]|nr:Long-chain-fatty-acid--CoA ligase [Alphaproteobacteria bacterium SO-S41]